MLQLYIDLSSSRLARHAIQPIHRSRCTVIAPPPSHLSAGGRRGRPSYQKNGRARNRQRPLAAIVCLRAHDKTLKVLEGSSRVRAETGFAESRLRTVIIGLSRHTSALGTELALPSAIARRRGPAHGASRPPHRAGRTQHTPSTAAQTPPQFNPQRHAGVTTRSASRSASRSAGRRTFRGRSPTRGRGQGRGGADDGGCPSAAARGGSGSHRVDVEDEPAPKRKKVM